MSHQLPEDVRRWPLDPYQLLGVAHSVNLRDLKKAYARLIRQYRPEDAPEQFRRIRDAFETLQQQAKFAAMFPPPPANDVDGADEPFPPEKIGPPKNAVPSDVPPEAKPPPASFPFNLDLERPDVDDTYADEDAAFDLNLPPDTDDDDEDADAYEGVATTWKYDAGETYSSGPISYELAPPPAPAADELAELWNRACAGELEFVYGRLRELYKQHQSDKDILLRLYWLLALAPDLDPVRHPCDYLVESLRSSGLADSSRELYRRYVVNHPEEALSPRFARLLQSPATPFHLAQLLEWRWQAAGRLREARVIVEDLEQFRQRLLAEDEATWARLLFFAADELAWFDNARVEGVFERCRRELEDLEHLQARFGEAFSRLDFLADLAKAWKKCAGDRTFGATRYAEEWTAVVNLVPLTWLRPLPEVRLLFLQYFASSWDNPLFTLDALDAVQRGGAVLLSQLVRVLETLLLTVPLPGGESAMDDIDARTRRFLDGTHAATYQQFRAKLLSFCLREHLSPERMADVVEQRSQDQNLISLFTEVRYDWPLRCLCLAHRLFWT